jgi:hypothetical protein
MHLQDCAVLNLLLNYFVAFFWLLSVINLDKTKKSASFPIGRNADFPIAISLPYFAFGAAARISGLASSANFSKFEINSFASWVAFAS